MDIGIQGFWWDVITRENDDGSEDVEITPVKKNQICASMPLALCKAFLTPNNGDFANIHHAIGIGDGAWITPPTVERSDTTLYNEVFGAGCRRNYDSMNWVKTAVGQATAAGTSFTIVDDKRWEETGWFNGMDIEITAGPGTGDIRVISNWDVSTKTITVIGAFSGGATDLTTEYRIVPDISTEPAGAIQIRTEWPAVAGAFNVVIREQGIFYDSSVTVLPIVSDVGHMLNKIYHAPITKTAAMQLERYIRFVFTIPRV